jgi:tetratricopeptide (TPR) repeat protein
VLIIKINQLLSNESLEKINRLEIEIIKMLRTPSDSVYNALGILYLRANQLNIAKKYFDESLNINPLNSESWIGLAEIESKKGNYSIFIELFDVADYLIEKKN